MASGAGGLERPGNAVSGSVHAGEESGVTALRSTAPKKLPVKDGEINRVSSGLHFHPTRNPRTPFADPPPRPSPYGRNSGRTEVDGYQRWKGRCDSARDGMVDAFAAGGRASHEAGGLDGQTRPRSPAHTARRGQRLSIPRTILPPQCWSRRWDGRMGAPRTVFLISPSPAVERLADSSTLEDNALHPTLLEQRGGA